MVAVIVACEVGFWVILALGLLARYGLRWPRVSAVMLVCVPVVDVVLLVATVIDLRGGAQASAAHGLAAAYIGFSVAFGHQTIRSLDQRVAHRFAGAPAPSRVPRSGPGRVQHEWLQFRRAVLAWAVACALLLAAIALVGDPHRTTQLTQWVWEMTAIVGIWLVVGPVLAQAIEAVSARTR